VLGHTLRLGNGPPIITARPIRNAVLALVEYSKGATLLRAKPVDLVVVPSTICNLRCVMCPHGMRLVEGPHHTPVELVARVEPFLATVSRILVSGLGEPISAPAFWWFIDHSGCREDLSFRTHTNGHLVTPEGAERILKSGLTEISCSLDAATSDTYSKIRGADFASALAGTSTLLRLRERIPKKGIEISINMTLMRENLSEAVPFIALAKKLGCDAVIFSQLFAFGDRPEWQVSRGDWRFRYSEQRLSRIPSEARDQLSRAREFAQEVGMPVHFFGNTSDYLK
jgi:MoaA/NifB/PqqE/SkfB family radical SAM enzyme